MKKLLKGLAIVAAVLLAVAAVVFFLGRHRIYSTPDWYRHERLDPARRAAAANSVDQKLIAARSGIAQAYADQTRSARGGQSATTVPSSQFALELSEEEINAWIPKWEQELNWKKKLGNYLDEPSIFFREHELILAAPVKEWNSIVSLHFVPAIQDGKLQVTLSDVMAGTLPLPRMAWDKYQQKLETSLSAKLPELQEEAEIDPHGGANSAAVQAALAELLLNTLHDRPSEPVLFVPDNLSGRAKSLPVKITGIAVADKSMTLTVEPMNAEERATLLKHLRAPFPSDTADTR